MPLRVPRDAARPGSRDRLISSGRGGLSRVDCLPSSTGLQPICARPLALGRYSARQSDRVSETTNGRVAYATSLFGCAEAAADGAHGLETRATGASPPPGQTDARSGGGSG